MSHLYLQKPCEAIQFTKNNIAEVIKFLPEDKFVVYGIETINGKDTKVFDDDLSSFNRIGGFFYYNKETKTLSETDWILKRKNIYEILNNTYFTENFVKIWNM